MNQELVSRLSIRDHVGVALRSARENWRFALSVAAIGAVITTLSTALVAATPALGLPATIVNTIVQAAVYAALTVAALYGVGEARARWTAAGFRVWAAMAVIGFFLFIVFFVITIPMMVALFSGPLGPYTPELQAAGSDEAAVFSVMERFAQENAGTLLLLFVFYAALWLYMTSRLYLSAPASIDRGRILTFETWSWTKGATLRIIGARLMLLVPANILAGALAYIVGALVGVNPITPDPGAGVPYLIFVLASTFIRFALYFSLESALSASLYRRLQPAEPAPAAS